MKRIIMTIAVCTALCATANTWAQKTVKLFNGKDLKNWNFVVKDNAVSPEHVFFIEKGMIHITGEPFGYMYTKEKYADYKLHVEWSWIDKPVNSGIFLLISDTKSPFPDCIECQLKAGDAGSFVLIGDSELKEVSFSPNVPRPKFPVRMRQSASSEKPTGEWNEANIFVKNGVITVYINGVYQNTGTSAVKEGNIALQSEGGNLLFRNVYLTK